MTDEEKKRIQAEHRHVHAGLRLWLAIYTIVSLGMLTLVMFHILNDEISPLYPGTALIVGALLGLILARISKIFWHYGERRIVFHFDKLGVIILAAYVIFELFYDVIVGFFIHDHSLFTTSLALLTGTFIGRVLGIQNKIRRLLREHL